MRNAHATVWLAVLACIASAPAVAYVGPGAGLTLLSALWGLLIAVVAAVGFLVLWPLRRWRRRRQALEAGGELDADDDQEPVANRSVRQPYGQDVDGR